MTVDPDRAWRWLCAGLPLAAFALYAWAAAPGVEWLDAGELTAAGFTLGVSHPPGQPLHALLAKAATLVPVGEVAFRVSLLSAAAAALTVRGVLALVAALVPRRDGAVVAGAGAGATLCALAPCLSAQATRPEVYAPLAALATWGAAWAVAFARERAARHALLAAFALALGAALQPLVAASVAAPLAVTLAARAGGRRLARLAPWALALGALALAVYAYLPLRALAPDRALLVWGDPSTPGAFLDVVRGKAYGGNFAASGWAGRVLQHLVLVAEGTGLPLVLLGGAGLGFGAATRLRGAGALGGAVLAVCAGAASLEIFLADNPDVHGYLAPALPLLAAGLALLVAGGARALARLVPGAPLGPGALGALLVGPVLAMGLVAPVVHVQDGGFRRGDDPSAFVDATLGRVPPGPALYLAESDHALFPAFYERLVAGDRPDVAVGSAHLATSSWLLVMIDRQVPELFVPWLDDGGDARALAQRLVGENLRARRPVWSQLPPEPPFGGAPYGLAWRLALDADAPGEPAGAPPRYQGELGRRIAREAGLVRARWESRHGRWLDAARAAGVVDRFDAAAQARLATAMMPPLWTEVPGASPVFVWADWQAELVARDAAFAAGFGPGDPPPPGAPLELRLLHAWHLFFAGDPGAEPALAALGADARIATARLCERLGRRSDAETQARAALAAAPDHEGAALFLGALLANHGNVGEAEAVLRAASARHPGSARVWAALGLALAKANKLDEARAAWRRSLELDPRQPQVRAFLERANP